MIFIDLYSRTPIYEQIEEQIISQINTGRLKQGDKLPSIRQLASDLGLNVNTVKRAFSELETKGVIVSYQGRGVFVGENAFKNDIVLTEAQESIIQAITSAKAKGMTKEEINSILNNIFEGD